MVNFYRPKAASKMLPLFEVLTKKAFSWTPSMDQAFVDVKSTLAEATLLVHPHPDALIAITSDASDVAVGAVLQQRISNQWVPLAFFSQKLKPPEKKYNNLRSGTSRTLFKYTAFSIFLGRPTVHCLYRSQAPHVLSIQTF